LESISDGVIRLLNEIIFPASPNERRAARLARESGGDNGSVVPTRSASITDVAIPVSPRKLGSPLCDTPGTVHSAMNLFVELTKGSSINLKQLRHILQHNWHSQAGLNNTFDLSSKYYLDLGDFFLHVMEKEIQRSLYETKIKFRQLLAPF